jgi:hypothetical protein
MSEEEDDVGADVYPWPCVPNYHSRQGWADASLGAPQLSLFLGCRQDIGTLLVPGSTHKEHTMLFDLPYATVSDAFYGLPQAQYSADIKTQKVN